METGPRNDVLRRQATALELRDRELLYLPLGGDAAALRGQLIACGWRPLEVHDLAAAARLQAQRRFPVVLLAVGAELPVPAAAVEACVQAFHGAEWLAVCEPAALASPGLRELLLGCFFDHAPLPLDERELAVMLEHAGRRALLRRRHETQAYAGDTLGMVGQGPAITRLRQQIRRVAATDAPVLIGGESGSGKELAARAIHQCSRRAAGPFVALNCGAISPSLIRSELFGHERGAFTGAASEHRGLIEAADGGTVFLDEIGDLPLELQTHLLRFLQEKAISRVGGVRSLRVDVRVLAASHVDLAEAVAAGRFRGDLFYRLDVLSLELTPLRRRMEDVPMLAEHFLQCCAAESKRRAKSLSRQALAAMMAYDWPGNVRELHNRVQRAVVMSASRLIGPADLGLAEAESPAALELDAARTMAERDAICLTLNRVGRNVTRAARELGISRMTLYRLMDKHRIVPGAPQAGYDGPGPPAALPLRTAPSIVAGYGPST